jgi:hypothetical protein
MLPLLCFHIYILKDYFLFLLHSSCIVAAGLQTFQPIKNGGFFNQCFFNAFMQIIMAKAMIVETQAFLR